VRRRRGGALEASLGRTRTSAQCVLEFYCWRGAGATSSRPDGSAPPRWVRAASPACAAVALQYAMGTTACFAIVRAQPVDSLGLQAGRKAARRHKPLTAVHRGFYLCVHILRASASRRGPNELRHHKPRAARYRTAACAWPPGTTVPPPPPPRASSACSPRPAQAPCVNPATGAQCLP